jgi:hypothetical protein
MPLSDPLSVVRKATNIFEKAGIRYLVGGSLASSLHGIPRSTQDVDIVADLNVQQVENILPLLSEHFYVDEEMAKDAVMRRSSFNVIDRELLYKLDIFVLSDDALAETEMKRRVGYRLADSDDQTMYVCSAEDIVAHKLYWYRLGDGVSERQWNDALNVVKVQREHLDMDYLTRTCSARGVGDLLEKLLKEYKT